MPEGSSCPTFQLCKWPTSGAPSNIPVAHCLPVSRIQLICSLIPPCGTSEVYKFASERQLTIMSIFLSGCMLSGKLPSTLMHVVIIPLLKCKSKDPPDDNNYRPIAIATALSKVLEQVLLMPLARYLWTADSQLGFKRAHGTEMAIFALKQTVDFYHNQDTPVYMCFLDAKKAFDRVNRWMLAKKLLYRNVPLHIVKLFIFWYREREFMVRWGNALSMTFRCANGIRQGDSYPHCCMMYIQMT